LAMSADLGNVLLMTISSSSSAISPTPVKLDPQL
jgi:hypothetical protein